jgi:Mrp family chromosome partitioning ATPase
LLSSARELKVVAVTSASSGEGKTSTATNLAVVMAQLGKRVLLLDADLRKPRLHEIFRVPNRNGVVNFLTGTATVDEILRQTGVPNLCVALRSDAPNPSASPGFDSHARVDRFSAGELTSPSSTRHPSWRSPMPF